jgi:hypothetical protein
VFIDGRGIERRAAVGTAPASSEVTTPAAFNERFQSGIQRWRKFLAGAGRE